MQVLLSEMQKKVVRMQTFCISGRKTGMSARISPVGRTIYYFATVQFHFHWVPGRKFLHLGPQNLHVGPPFSPVGRAVCYLTFISIGFQAGSFCISGKKPECRPTIYYFTILLSHFHWVPGRNILHLGPQNLLVGSRFFYVRPPILHVRRTLASPRVFVASRTAHPACRLTFLHVGQTYPWYRRGCFRIPIESEPETSARADLPREFPMSGKPRGGGHRVGGSGILTKFCNVPPIVAFCPPYPPL